MLPHPLSTQMILPTSAPSQKQQPREGQAYQIISPQAQVERALQQHGAMVLQRQHSGGGGERRGGKKDAAYYRLSGHGHHVSGDSVMIAANLDMQTRQRQAQKPFTGYGMPGVGVPGVGVPPGYTMPGVGVTPGVTGYGMPGVGVASGAPGYVGVATGAATGYSVPGNKVLTGSSEVVPVSAPPHAKVAANKRPLLPTPPAPPPPRIPPAQPWTPRGPLPSSHGNAIQQQQPPYHESRNLAGYAPGTGPALLGGVATYHRNQI